MSDTINKVRLTENLIELLQCGVAPSFEDMERAKALGIDVAKLKKVHGDENTTN